MRKTKQVTDAEKIKKKSLNIEILDDDKADDAGNFYVVEISRIVVSSLEPQARRRKFFKPEKISRLGDSILRHGLRQPILLRPRTLPSIESADTNYADLEIVYGECRFLASVKKGLTRIKAFIEIVSDAEAIELQHAENHDRENPDPLTDAFTYQYLIEKEGYTEETISDHFNIAPKLVTERLQLNKLIDEAKQLLTDGVLPLRHAYFLATFPVQSQEEIARENLAFKWRDRENGSVSYNDFKREVEENITRRLADAPFDTENSELHLKGLKCSDCTQCSDHAPKLFFDHFGANNTCLNKNCFEAKTRVHFTIEREKIAETLPNPKALPIKEMAKKVPIVSDRQTSVAAFKEKPQIVETMQIESECEFAQASLAVAGANKGKQVYICNEKTCPVHYPPVEPEADDSGISLMRANQIRMEVFRRALDWFDDYKVIWQFDDLIKNLIVEMLWETRLTHGDDILFLIRNKNFQFVPRNFMNREGLRVFASTLDKRQQSQILFLLANLSQLYASSTEIDNDLKIRAIALNYGNLDYEQIVAES